MQAALSSTVGGDRDATLLLAMVLSAALSVLAFFLARRLFESLVSPHRHDAALLIAAAWYASPISVQNTMNGLETVGGHLHQPHPDLDRAPGAPAWRRETVLARRRDHRAVRRSRVLDARRCGVAVRGHRRRRDGSAPWAGANSRTDGASGPPRCSAPCSAPRGASIRWSGSVI